MFGKFSNAVSFSINPVGSIYITDADKNEIIKLDTLGNELNRIGGYGWNPAAFDFPADIFAQTLKVYVADKNNNRIQVFDKDLNFRYELTIRIDKRKDRKRIYHLRLSNRLRSFKPRRFFYSGQRQ